MHSIRKKKDMFWKREKERGEEIKRKDTPKEHKKKKKKDEEKKNHSIKSTTS